MPFILQSCQCQTAYRVGCRVYGIRVYGSGCGVIKVQSWHFPEGTEVSYEMCQDRQCPHPDLNQAFSHQ